MHAHTHIHNRISQCLTVGTCSVFIYLLLPVFASGLSSSQAGSKTHTYIVCFFSLPVVWPTLEHLQRYPSLTHEHLVRWIQLVHFWTKLVLRLRVQRYFLAANNQDTAQSWSCVTGAIFWVIKHGRLQEKHLRPMGQWGTSESLRHRAQMFCWSAVCLTLHGSWIAQTSIPKSGTSILLSSNRKHFHSFLNGICIP